MGQAFLTDIVVCNVSTNWCRKGNHGTEGKEVR